MDGCIIHYDSISTANTLCEVTVITLPTLQNSKAIRENLGGDNLHHEQGNGIPEDLGKKYDYHSEFFKKYVYVKTLAKRKENEDACEPSRSKRQKDSSERGLFGDNCMVCKKHQIKVGHTFQLPKKLLTLDGVNNIKKAGEMTEDEESLSEITEVDLVAKEFKRHDKCYHDYTRVLYATKTKTPVNEKCNFEDVCRLIDDDVIVSRKCVSMNILIDVYGIGKDQHQYRKYWKARIERHFGERICFITFEYHEVQIVISTRCIHEETFFSHIELSDNRILVLAARII